jgi:DNA-binding transcriptional MerR regulator
MVVHQLDLFGGPLKPPKKIVVDDDLPVEEPQQLITDEPAVAPDNEPELVSDVAGPEEENLAGADDTNEVTSNNAEWVTEPEGADVAIDDNEAFEEPVEEMIATIADEPEADDAFVTEGAEIAIPEASDEQDDFTDEAIFEMQPGESEEPEVGMPQDEHIETTVNTESFEEVATAPGPEPVAEAVQTRGRKQITENGNEYEADGLNVPPDEQLFKRQYYSMRETSAMFGVNQSLLRFWENEFDILQPKKNKKGDRYFRPVDIKNLVLIYHLLRTRKFTLDGAKDYLQSHKHAGDTFELIQRLEKLKSFLLELKAGL